MKIHQLDPRHKTLLNDHTSGYWWVRSLHPADKYKGRIVFTSDFGRDLEISVRRKVAARRLRGGLITFKRHGYVFSSTEFIKVLAAKTQSEANLAKAKEVAKQLVANLKREAKAIATAKMLRTRHGPDYTGPKRVYKNPGSRGERTLWIWSFENKELGKSHEHIFHFIDFGVQVGKSRREFTDYYGLRYECMQALAAGTIKAHRGWTLIGKPTRVTHRQAIAMKIKQLNPL